MQDCDIVELFFERDEQAIAETQKKYEKYCLYIANGILHCCEDAEECANDAYSRLWQLIPPARPARLSAFLGKLVRGLAIDKLRESHAKKRGGPELVLEELDECLGDASACDEPDIDLRDAINRFLGELPDDARVIFVQRYWYMCSVREISRETGSSESRVKVTLARTREKLRRYLEKEGFSV